jgi:uncharacterized protein YkwD
MQTTTALALRRAAIAAAVAAIGVVGATGAAPALATAPRGLAGPARPAQSAPCPGENLVPNAGNLARVRTATLCLVNLRRRAGHVAPLRDNAALDYAAQSHSHDMVARSYFSHYTPSGTSPPVRDARAGYRGNYIGENLAWGEFSLGTPAAIVGLWMSDQGHRENILDPSYRDSGIGIVPGVPIAGGGRLFGGTYTQDFGAQ